MEQDIIPQLAKFNPTVCSIVLLCVYAEDYTKNEKKTKKKTGHMWTRCQNREREWWQEAQTHIICDFLSQVGLCDKDLGNFLTGSAKHAGNQRVFTIPQSGPLYKIIDKERKWSQTHTCATFLAAQSQWKLRPTPRLVHHVKDKLFRFILHLHKTQIDIIFSFITSHFKTQHWKCNQCLTLNLCSSRLRTCIVVMELFTLTLVTEP